MRSRADIELRVANGMRSALRRLGRALLVLAMTSSSMVASFVGEALVLHQHGGRWVHLHTLGSGELQSDAARSPQFGHRSGIATSLRPGSQTVHILAIITTGLVFVPSVDTFGDVVAGPDSLRIEPPVVGAEMQAPMSIASSSDRTSWFGGSTTAAILQRNHSLLI